MANTNIMNFGLLIVFIAMIYFLMIRPQKKKEKEEKAMRESLKVGDEILTIGGIKGKIVKVSEQTVVIATGADRTKLEFVKSAVGTVLKDDKSAEAKAEKTEEPVEEKAPDRSKKVTPKKLTKTEE